MSPPESSEAIAAETPAARSNVLGHVASSVVHSVINHFSAIVSQAEMLKLRNQNPAEVASRAEAIIKSALIGSTMARRLAEYSRSAMPAELTPVRLDEMIAAHVGARRGDAPPGVELLDDLGARAVFPADEGRLRAMLDCLIDNAFEAFHDARRGGVVTVSTRLDPVGWLELDVRDDGPGMHPDVLEEALEPFFTTKLDHAGVGLPLARSLWRRHRGAFTLEAPLGRGTLVRLTRPPTDPS